MSMMKEFKEFAMKGNLIDMAIAFVMGVAFAKIVTAFIDGMVMPLVGKLTAGVDFKSLKIVISDAVLDASGNVVTAETAIRYGEFITVLIDFLLVAFVMFMIIKSVNKLKRKEEAAPVAPPPPSDEVKLLTEIRDLLRK